MSWEVLEVVGLPIQEEREVYPGVTVPVPTGESIRKEPGDTISKKEMEAAGQDDAAIAALIEVGAIKEAK